MGGWTESWRARDTVATRGLSVALARAFAAVGVLSVLSGVTAVFVARAPSLTLAMALAVLPAALVAMCFRKALRAIESVSIPVWSLRRTVACLTTGDATARAQPTGPIELRDLAESLNHLAAQTEAVAASQAIRLLDERILGDIRRRIHASLAVETLLPDALAALGPMIDADRIRVWLDGNDGELHAVASWHAHGVSESTPERPASVTSRLRTVKQVVHRDSWPLVVDDTSPRPEETADPTAVAFAAVGVRALIVCPLGGVADGSRGVLAVHAVGGPRHWTQHELALVEAVAKEIGTAVSHANTYALERESVRRLERLDAEKSTFVSSVSHELRTPLTSIMGYVEMLKDGEAGPLSPDQELMFGIIDRNGQRLLGLIEDLLVLSQLEAGLPLAAVEIDVADLVARAIDALAFAARRQNVRLSSVVGGEVGRIPGDVDQLERVMLNLVGNAVKFTPAGGQVDVEAHREGDRVRITVSDTGIGIPSDEHHRLFSRFFRSSNAQSGAITGTGLGLSIVKKLIEAHEGQVSIASVPDLGTTVTVELPAAERRSNELESTS